MKQIYIIILISIFMFSCNQFEEKSKIDFSLDIKNITSYKSYRVIIKDNQDKEVENFCENKSDKKSVFFIRLKLNDVIHKYCWICLYRECHHFPT